MSFIYIYIAGVLVFLTPCILPILPFFVSSVLGVNRNEIKKKELLIRTLMFCLGLTIVMAVLGAGISAVIVSVNNYKNFFEVIAGIIMLLFSLYYLNIIDIPFLNQTKATNKKNFTKSNYLNSLLLGILFSFTWSPCLSPIMASVLSFVALKNSSILGSIFKMIFFAFGISTPLILATFFWSNFEKFFKNNPALPIIIKKVLGTIVLLFCFNLIFNATVHEKKISSELSKSLEQEKQFIYNKNTIAMLISADCEYCELAALSLEKIRKKCPDLGISYLDVSDPATYSVIKENDLLGTPFFLFYNEKNQLLKKISGYIEEAEMLETINSIFKAKCKI